MSAFYKLPGSAAAAIVCLALAGCADKTHENAPPSMTAEVAAEIEAICGLPAGALAGLVPVSDAMPKIACAAEEARKRNIAVGFISNPADPDA